MEFSHLDEHGVKMVDVGNKEKTARVAVATGEIRLNPDTIVLVKEGKTKKGDVLTTARIAGIQAAKKTSEWIPLCHNIFLTNVQVDFAVAEDRIYATATASTNAETGVEMEALTAVSAALLTVYDMTKAVDKKATLSEIKLVYKSGGKSGLFVNGTKKGVVKSVNISEKRGVVKHPRDKVNVIADYGIEGDSHAEAYSKRQISFLGDESVDKMRALGVQGLCFGKFAENVTTEGIELFSLPVGTKLLIGRTLHAVTQIGKKCHAADGCEIAKTVGTCVMPKEGIFTRALSSGEVSPGDPIYVLFDGGERE